MTDLSTIIGFDLDGRGFKQANQDLDTHAQGWERVDAITNRVGGSVDRIAGRIAGLAGVVGLGAIISDFAQLDAVASRAALSVGRVGGRGGFSPYASAINDAATATSQNPGQLGSALLGVQGSVGGYGGPASWRRAGVDIGAFSRAYGVDVGTVGGDLGQMLMAQRMTGADGSHLLAQIANQAARSGMAGQTPQFLQAVTTATGLIGGLHPGQTGPGLSGRLGAMYGAAASANPAFRDPSLFAQGVGGVDQGVTQAYRSPGLEAALTMAGISYRDQRGGLAGSHGRAVARKLLDYTGRVYGRGSTEEDLFLRSNFGDVSSDMLSALASGSKSWSDLSHPGHAPGPSTADRAHSDQATLGAQQQRLRNQGVGASKGFLNKLLDLTQHISFTEAVAGLVGIKVTPRILRVLYRRFGKKAAEEVVEKAAGSAGAAAAGGAFDLLGAADRVRQAAGAGAEGAGEAAAGLGARAALKFLGAGVGTAADALIFPSKAGEDPQSLARFSAQNQWTYLSKKFGSNWYNNPKAIEYARSHGEIDVVGHDKSKSDWWLRSAIQQARGAKGGSTATATGDPVDAFTKAVERFSQTVKKLDLAGGRKTASYDGGLNAAGAAGLNDQVGSSMILARMVTGGGAAAGGTAGATPASYTSSSASAATGGRAAAGGGAGGSGAGWQAGTATFYDPSLGGRNGRVGGGAWSGHPIDGSEWGCAADPKFPMGTRVEIAFKGKSTVVTVMDRGGMISGNHFDLLPGPAKYLGVGNDKIRFRVVGRSSAEAGKNAGASSSGGGGGGGSTGSSGGGSSRAKPNVEDTQKGAKDVTSAHPHVTTAAMTDWMRQPATPHRDSWGSANIIVNVDGMTVDRRRRLTRGS